MPQLARMTFQRAESLCFKWPYQAMVINRLENTSRTMGSQRDWDKAFVAFISARSIAGKPSRRAGEFGNLSDWAHCSRPSYRDALLAQIFLHLLDREFAVVKNARGEDGVGFAFE